MGLDHRQTSKLSEPYIEMMSDLYDSNKKQKDENLQQPDESGLTTTPLVSKRSISSTNYTGIQPGVFSIASSPELGGFFF